MRRHARTWARTKKKKSYPGAYIGTYDDTNTTFCMADTLWTAFLRLFFFPGVFVTWEPRISIPRRQFIIAIINVVEYHLFFIFNHSDFRWIIFCDHDKKQKNKKKGGGVFGESGVSFLYDILGTGWDLIYTESFFLFLLMLVSRFIFNILLIFLEYLYFIIYVFMFSCFSFLSCLVSFRRALILISVVDTPDNHVL